ncbi:hypothetical protein [Patulibacter sp. SYSU D01012]|uniref:hypothetical protein n=1 Tax=Patulibacter sp. SYSU D01012 TaxID=2817381 RepID=UPI001B3061DB|nr:hypothetical protein [Patulibacter sp. SYSU D01012]
MTAPARRPLVRLLLVALLVGVVAGGLAALLLPATRAADRATGAAQRAARPGAVLRTAAARPEPREPGRLLLRVHGTPRIEARAADPLGGPDWAVRVFRADRTFHDPRRHGRLVTIGTSRCVQLGRLHRGRFGWLDGAGTFRPVRPSLFAAPAWCGSRRPDLRGDPHVDALTAITGIDDERPRLGATVLWGLVGPAARDVRTSIGGREERGAAGGPDGAILRVARPAAARRGIAVSLRYPGDRAARTRVVRRRSVPARIGVRAPAPGGGVPFALPTVRGPRGWCVGPVGRVVEGRVGRITFGLGTFAETTAAEVRRMDRGCARRPPRLTRRMPAVVHSGGGDMGGEPDDVVGEREPDHVTRRTLPGLTYFGGRVRDDVVAITLKTPRDIRTVRPTGPAHAFLAVVDGTFASGRSRTIYRFADGTTRVDGFGLGMF